MYHTIPPPGGVDNITTTKHAAEMFVLCAHEANTHLFEALDREHDGNLADGGSAG